MTSKALPSKQTNGVYMQGLASLCLRRLIPSKRFTSTRERSVLALRGSTMQPSLFLPAPRGGGKYVSVSPFLCKHELGFKVWHLFSTHEASLGRPKITKHNTKIAIVNENPCSKFS